MYISLYQPIIFGFLLCSIEVPPRFEDKRSINFSTITGIPCFFWGGSGSILGKEVGQKGSQPILSEDGERLERGDEIMIIWSNYRSWVDQVQIFDKFERFATQICRNKRRQCLVWYYGNMVVFLCMTTSVIWYLLFQSYSHERFSVAMMLS